MNRLWRKLGAETGGYRPVQVILMFAGAALIYAIVMYSPSMLHQMSLAAIADDFVARMNVNFNDEVLRHQVIEQATTQGIHLNPANVILERQTNPVQNIVVITWEERIDHVWGSEEILKKKVVAKAKMGELKK